MSHFMRPQVAPPVASADEAALMVVHHLIMAATYFELTADDRGESIDRIITARCNDLDKDACLQFVRTILRSYDQYDEVER
jgi:hypothetical protein